MDWYRLSKDQLVDFLALYNINNNGRSKRELISLVDQLFSQILSHQGKVTPPIRDLYIASLIKNNILRYSREQIWQLTNFQLQEFATIMHLEFQEANLPDHLFRILDWAGLVSPYFPEEIIRHISYQVTDLVTIVRLEQTSPQFSQYFREIKLLTTDKFLTIPLAPLLKYSHLQYIDHKIAIDFHPMIKFGNQIKQAHWVTEPSNLPQLIKILPLEGYFKISILYSIICGISIIDNQALIMAPIIHNNYSDVEYVICKSRFTLINFLQPTKFDPLLVNR